MSADRGAAVSDPALILSPSGRVRLATCGWCWAATGQPCVTTRHGAPAARPGELAALITEVTSLSAADAAQEAAEMLTAPAPAPAPRPADGSHLARWLRAERRGLIFREELTAALARVDVITADVVIPDGGPAEASGQLGTGPAAGGQR